MNLYTAPVAGTYNYRTRNFNGSFNLFQIKVNIIGESLKSYLVEVLTPLPDTNASAALLCASTTST